MKITLVAINAKYIHSNLAVHSLQAYALQRGWQTETVEYTINQQFGEVLEDLYRQDADVLAFSCYIWNITFVRELAEELHKIAPEIQIWAGGPEVSFDTEIFLNNNPAFTGVMRGEGEEIFARLCGYYMSGTPALGEIPGITWREIMETTSDAACQTVMGESPYIASQAAENQQCDIASPTINGELHSNPPMPPLSMDEIPFCYGEMDDWKHRIIYYETSRGCPFSCSYCLSSIDKKLRFRSLDLVRQELQFFLDRQVPQVKFVDRTFNCREDHALAIWTYIKEHDNGVTNFHFEIAADLLTPMELELMKDMRPGLIQLEIGVQSVHDDTLQTVGRRMDLEKVKTAVRKVQAEKNIHQHLDLIAGLPLEDYKGFQESFDEIYALHSEQLQLGFLKVLKGSRMQEQAATYGIRYRSAAPYEVLDTPWISFKEMMDIRLVESMLEIHYNSGQFRTFMDLLEKHWGSAFQMFLDLGHFYESRGLLKMNHSRIKRTELLYLFAKEQDPEREAWYREALIFDLYRIEKARSRPEWAPDPSSYKKEAGQIRHDLELKSTYCHVEPFSYLEWHQGQVTWRDIPQIRWYVFDYGHRDPLTNGARIEVVSQP